MTIETKIWDIQSSIEHFEKEKNNTNKIISMNYEILINWLKELKSLREEKIQKQVFKMGEKLEEQISQIAKDQSGLREKFESLAPLLHGLSPLINVKDEINE